MNKVDKKIIDYIERAGEIHFNKKDKFMLNEFSIVIEIAKMIQLEELNKPIVNIKLLKTKYEKEKKM